MEMSCAQMFGSIQRQPLYHPHNYLMPCASTFTHGKRNQIEMNEYTDLRGFLCVIYAGYLRRERRMKDINYKEYDI